jgi:hypothetical protein
LRQASEGQLGKIREKITEAQKAELELHRLKPGGIATEGLTAEQLEGRRKALGGQIQAAYGEAVRRTLRAFNIDPRAARDIKVDLSLNVRRDAEKGTHFAATDPNRVIRLSREAFTYGRDSAGAPLPSPHQLAATILHELGHAYQFLRNPGPGPAEGTRAFTQDEYQARRVEILGAQKIGVPTQILNQLLKERAPYDIAARGYR